MNQFTQPAKGQTVTIPVVRHPFTVGMVVFHQFGGYYRVVNCTTQSLTLANLGVQSDEPYPIGWSNPAPGSTINNQGAKIAPAAELGRTGPKGDKGDQGSVGPIGADGARGERGYPGFLVGKVGCATVNSGVDGVCIGNVVTHALHGFKSGDAIVVSADYDKEYELASAADPEKQTVVGVVQAVLDENRFVFVSKGRVYFPIQDDGSGMPAWAGGQIFPGAVYYLSDTPGQLSLTPGSTAIKVMVGYDEQVGYVL